MYTVPAAGTSACRTPIMLIILSTATCTILMAVIATITDRSNELSKGWQNTPDTKGRERPFSVPVCQVFEWPSDSLYATSYLQTLRT
jgi:hypothetical protein